MATLPGKFLHPRALSFDDVYLVPARSGIRSRYDPNELSTTTRLAREAPGLNIPIISANMDTVTEANMAITMALMGGIGVIHRNLTIQEQAQKVKSVKEKVRVIEEDPPRVLESASIQDALDLIETRKRGYVIVYPEEPYTGVFSGIATTRDFLKDTPDAPITRVMAPNIKGELLTVPQGTTLEDAVIFMKKHGIEKVPMVDSEGLLIGVFALKDHELREQYSRAALDNRGKLLVGGAVGVMNTPEKQEVKRAHMLVDAGADVLVIDIAHGHHDYTFEMLHQLKVTEGIKIPIIAGNIATEIAAEELYDAGADALKVGIGPGEQCETRVIAGAGVPQITAIYNVYDAMTRKAEPIPVIADGGIKSSGDIVKALVAGADTVMIGTLLAGTDDSPGKLIPVKGVLHKSVRGMASASAFERRQTLGASTTNAAEYVPEGRETLTPYRGRTEVVVRDLVNGLRSGMSYAGARHISELHAKGQLCIITRPKS